MSKKSDNLKFTEEELKSFNLLLRFQQLMLKACANHPLSKSEQDKRRKLSAVDYYSAIIFCFFNPVIKSMRSICAASKLQKVQKKVCTNKISLGSFSEAQHVFSPELLREVLQELTRELPQNNFVDPKIREALNEILAVDGTLIPALPRMCWALFQRDGKNNAAKMHLTFSVLKGLPEDAEFSTANCCERKTLLNMLKKGDFYVGDRYYGLQYSYFNQIRDAGADAAFRIRNDANIHIIKELEVTEEDRKHGVVNSYTATLGNNWQGEPIKLVKVEAFDREILIACTRQDLPAWMIGVIYSYRWQIELFFKWLKCILGSRHLLAESENGVAIQFYCALIASVLLFALTGKTPTKRQFEMIQLYWSGWATEEELLKSLKLK